MPFPKQLLVTYDKQDDFHLAHQTFEEAVGGSTDRVEVATYELVKVNEARTTVEILTEVG